jgi:hypothetical protein
MCFLLLKLKGKKIESLSLLNTLPCEKAHNNMPSPLRVRTANCCPWLGTQNWNEESIK